MDRVFKYFLDEYRKGRTPNPDVLCNREIKFGPFAEYANKLGADFVATGHYCDISRDGEKTMLLSALDDNKDQTYFLNQVKTTQLQNVMFPLGNMKKTQVREIAEREGLVTAKKKDSTGICFIGERKFRKFLSEYLPGKKGDITDTEGKVIGEHLGLMYYTLGQRRGLGLGGTTDSQDRWFVVEKDMANNRLVVSHGDESVLMSKSLTASTLNWIPSLPGRQFTCRAKFRYRQPEQGVDVTINDDGTANVLFHEPQRAVTPGQFVVFYDDTACLGGGIIETVTK